MKRFMVILMALVAFMLTSCGMDNMAAQTNFEREQQTAKYQSEYARTINKLEMREGNFEAPRRVIFYNVRLGETVFVCEGYSHVQIDSDGDCEIVIKTGEGKFLRHYLGLGPDITYYSEQLEANKNVDNYKYKVTFNPKLWLPEFDNNL